MQILKNNLEEQLVENKAISRGLLPPSGSYAKNYTLATSW